MRAIITAITIINVTMAVTVPPIPALVNEHTAIIIGLELVHGSTDGPVEFVAYAGAAAAKYASIPDIVVNNFFTIFRLNSFFSFVKGQK